MELTDYWRLIRGWGLLVLLGTVLAGGIGYAIPVIQQRNAAGSFTGTSTLALHYSTCNGCPYNPTQSTYAEAVSLSNQANSANTLDAVAARTGTGAPQVQTIKTSVDPTTFVVTINVSGTDGHAVQTFAAGLASFLADVENRKLAAQEKTILDQAARRLAQTKTAWFAARRQYFAVCGCLTSKSRVLVSPTRLADIRANLGIYQNDYESASNRYQALVGTPIPAASPGSSFVQKAAVKKVSLARSALPAAILGLLLSIGLAALLDYWLSQRVSRQGPRSLRHDERATNSDPAEETAPRPPLERRPG